MFLTGEERWKVLRLHVEDQISLAALARETGISTRTLQRWLRLYRAGGAGALDLGPRADAGTRRVDPEMVRFIEGLALTKPRPRMATLHRLAAAEAGRRGAPAPSYRRRSVIPFASPVAETHTGTATIQLGA
ncbi:helix-turn-helix domain-containing protein [Arthrobacter sp. Bz4]|uniref:helix-turn-helix domain-containing protein n=1 Tax=Arthrobacter sp. Bz4 TaxID=2171979 RepID=UPI001FAEE7A5|nr:helix-turn-helix domain-containing protein [Arthrobacter sp. Bz4]